MNRLKSAYLDSNIFIYTILYSGDVAEKSKRYLEKAADGEFCACASPLTWDEVVYVVRKMAGIEKSIKAGKILLEMPFLRFLDVDASACKDAQRLVERYRLMPRDAIHASLAIKHCDGVIISNDTDFDAIEGLKRLF